MIGCIINHSAVLWCAYIRAFTCYCTAKHFNSLGPDPPLASIEVVYHPTLLPQLYLTIRGQPLWPDYEISEFRVTIINATSGSLLQQIIAPNNSTNDTFQLQVHESLFMFTTDHCYSLMINATVVSPQYDGQSEPNQTITPMIRTPGSFSGVNQVNSLVMFTSSGTLSHVTLRIQLPDVCTHQNINYTIVIEAFGVSNETMESVLHGPYTHRGPGVIFQDISGLKDDCTYSVIVQVASLPGSSESTKHFFSTRREFESAMNIPLTPSDVSLVYKVIMGFFIGLALVLLSAFSILLGCFCVRHQQMQHQGNSSTNQASDVNHTMVPNPIYDSGQIYDSIGPPSDHQTQRNVGQSLQQTMPRYSYSPSCNKSSPDTRAHTHMFPRSNHSKCVGMPNSLIPCKYEDSSRLVSCSEEASSVPTVSNATSKKTKKDRNKLHLILPGLSPSDDKIKVTHNIMQDTDKSEEGQYIEMSQTGTHRQQAFQPAAQQ